MIKAIIFDFFGVVEKDGSPDDELVELIKTGLKPEYKIGMISNSSGAAIRQLLGKATDIFDDIVVSGQVNLYKPEPAIYELAARRLNVGPEQCVYIDDTLIRCDGARTAGMQAIVYKDFRQVKTELEAILNKGKE
ncbi:MAG TPA: HAD-IA family hydrolase [Candidatus Saccharimonadales bacterium]|nr:HAD-IA family hydrolase [Candidatus Saccharimonadales bacterium]